MANLDREYAKKYNIHYCEASNPWQGGGGRVMHEEAREIADYGETRRMKCKVCGHEWDEELPQ